ncbi:MAG: nitroreductase family protein [archaeon]
MDLVSAIKSRKSVKNFDGKVPSWKKVIQAIDVARFAPMAGNMFSVKFIIVEDRNKIDKIAGASQQPFVSKAGALVVLTSNREKVRKMFDANEKGFAQQQAGAVIQNFLLTLTEKGIDSCWVGFFDDDIVRSAVGVPGSEEVEAVIAIGFAGKQPVSKKQKADLENIVFFEKYGAKKKEPPIVVRRDGA